MQAKNKNELFSALLVAFSKTPIKITTLTFNRI
jgi:hypothetical protein